MFYGTDATGEVKVCFTRRSPPETTFSEMSIVMHVDDAEDLVFKRADAMDLLRSLQTALGKPIEPR